MLLLYIYIATFIIGGILLGASLFMGHHDADTDMDADADMHMDADMDADADFDADADIDADADFDADADIDADADADADAHLDGDLDHGTDGVELSDIWLPFTSMRFWVFFLCFFGITGILLTLLALAGKWATFAAALSMGTVTGFVAAFIIQRLKRQVVGQSLGTADYKGQEATVLIPIEPDAKGKIRMEVRENTIDMLATCDERVTVARGSKVLVIEIKDNEALVIPAPELESITTEED